MRQSSAVPTTADTTMMMAETLLEGVAGTLETLLIADVVKCMWVSKRCVSISDTLLTGGVTVDSELVTSIVSLYTSDDCDDGVSGVDTVEQFMGITMSSKLQHILFSLLQIVQALLLLNVILMMSDGVNVSFTSAVHHLAFPVVMASL